MILRWSLFTSTTLVLIAACGGTEQDDTDDFDTVSAAACFVLDDVSDYCGVQCARSLPSITGSGGSGPYTLSPGGVDVDVFRVPVPQGAWWVGFATGPSTSGSIDTTCTVLDTTRICAPIGYDLNETATGISTNSELGCKTWVKVVSPAGPTSVQVAVTHGAASPLARGAYRVFTTNGVAHERTPPPWAPYPGYGDGSDTVGP